MRIAADQRAVLRSPDESTARIVTNKSATRARTFTHPHSASAGRSDTAVRGVNTAAARGRVRKEEPPLAQVSRCKESAASRRASLPSRYTSRSPFRHTPTPRRRRGQNPTARATEPSAENPEGPCTPTASIKAVSELAKETSRSSGVLTVAVGPDHAQSQTVALVSPDQRSPHRWGHDTRRVIRPDRPRRAPRTLPGTSWPTPPIVDCCERSRGPRRAGTAHGLTGRSVFLVAHTGQCATPSTLRTMCCRRQSNRRQCRDAFFHKHRAATFLIRSVDARTPCSLR